MSKFLLTVCAFGLLFSSALAQEKSREELDRESLRIWASRDCGKTKQRALFHLEQTSALYLSLG
jgi:hypothetical protein